MREIRTRKLHYKNKIIDVIPEEEFENKFEDSSIFKQTKENNNVNTTTVIALVLVLSLISGCLGAFMMQLTVTPSTTTNGGITTSVAPLSETNSIATAVDAVYDSTVVVEVYANGNLYSTGTGFVYKKINNKAYLMTNNHVVSGGEEVKILFTNGDEITATVVGADTYSDIAVLSIKDSEKIKAATLGDSSKSKVGDTLFTVGSPEGSDYAGTVTKGILSGKDRMVEVSLASSSSSDYYMNVLQTDAAINPGNSGGPICNTNGEVIGITNMKLVDDSVEGMGFAIPIEDALTVAEILEKDGKIRRPYIGISMLDLSNSFYLWQAGITIPEGIEKGVAVYQVENGSPAANAGLKKGDIITKLAGKNIKNLAGFRYELYKHQPNETIDITFYRNGKEQTAKITLGKGEN